MKKLALLLYILLLLTFQALSQNISFSAYITDSSGNRVQLSNVISQGSQFFKCKYGDSKFNLSFEKIKTIVFEKEMESDHLYYLLANVEFVNGTNQKLLVDYKGERVGGFNTSFFQSLIISGINSTFGSNLKYELNKVKKIEFLHDR